MLNYIVGEPIREDLSRKWWDSYSSRLALQEIAESLEIRVATTDDRGAESERGNVGSAFNRIVCVHVATYTVRAGRLDLYEVISKCTSQAR